MNNVKLKEARVSRWLAGEKVASSCGFSTDSYYKKERGDTAISPKDAFDITKALGLDSQEFIDIFFDGVLPFLQDDRKCCATKHGVYPLAEMRVSSGLSTKQVAQNLGIPEELYIKKEVGISKITSLELCATISVMFNLSFDEFNDVFFGSQLPFSKDDFFHCKDILPQKDGEINAEAGHGSVD